MLWLLYLCCGFLVCVMTFEVVYFLLTCVVSFVFAKPLGYADMHVFVVPNTLSAAKYHTAGINSLLNS